MLALISVTEALSSSAAAATACTLPRVSRVASVAWSRAWVAAVMSAANFITL